MYKVVMEVRKYAFGLVTVAKETGGMRELEIVQLEAEIDLAFKASMRTDSPIYEKLRGELISRKLDLESISRLAKDIYIGGRRVPFLSRPAPAESAQLFILSGVRRELINDQADFMVEHKLGALHTQLEWENFMTQVRLKTSDEHIRKPWMELLSQATFFRQSLLESSPVIEDQTVEEDLLVAA